MVILDLGRKGLGGVAEKVRLCPVATLVWGAKTSSVREVGERRRAGNSYPWPYDPGPVPSLSGPLFGSMQGRLGPGRQAILLALPTP